MLHRQRPVDSRTAGGELLAYHLQKDNLKGKEEP